jgi:hypothetical protein
MVTSTGLQCPKGRWSAQKTRSAKRSQCQDINVKPRELDTYVQRVRKNKLEDDDRLNKYYLQERLILKNKETKDQELKKAIFLQTSSIPLSKNLLMQKTKKQVRYQKNDTTL